MTLETGRSGFSIPSNYQPPVPPSFETYSSATAAECAFVFGAFTPGTTVEFFYDGDWQALHPDCYLFGGKFFLPYNLKTGANAIAVRSVDPLGNRSSSAFITVTRHERKLVRGVQDTVLHNTVDVTAYASDLQVESATADGLIRIGVTLSGYGTTVTTDDTITATINDGAAPSTRVCRVLTVERTWDNGRRNQRVIAQGEADALPRLILSTTFTGENNGSTLKKIFERAGYTTIYVPAGGQYTGPRSIAKREVYEDIVKPILFAQDWLIWQLTSTAIAVLPSYAARFVSWTYSDSLVTLLSDTEDRAYLLNRARAVYQPAEADLNINYKLADQIPDKSDETTDGFAWFDDDSYQREATAYSSDSVLFFAAYGGNIAWDRVQRSVLKIKFNNSPTDVGGSRFVYNVDLEVFSDKKIAVGYFDTRRYHMPRGTVIYYTYSVLDRDGRFIGNGTIWRTLVLSGTSATNFQELVTTFGVQLSEVREVAHVTKSWTVTTPDDGPNQDDADEDIVYARYDLNGTRIEYTFYLEVDVDDLAVQTVDFDIRQATRTTTDPVHFLNCQLVTEGNQEYNQNPYIYGVISHKPNKPIRRVDKLVFKFTARLRLGEKISLSFRVYGRQFIDAPGFEDYEDINLEYKNAASVTKYGEIDGGCLLSSFWSSEEQARRRLVKFVDSRAFPVYRSVLQVPGSSEMRAGQVIRVFTNASGGAYNTYYFVTSVAPDKKQNKIEAIRSVPVAVANDIAENVPPDITFDLADALAALNPVLKTLQFGTVAANKYRGMFRVNLESGVEIQNVLSRLPTVKSGDKVACIQTAEGTWLIVEIITPSTENSDLEEDLPPFDELTDDEAVEKIIDDSIPNADALRQSQQDAANRQSKFRPVPNFITVAKMSTTPAPIESEIPYRGVEFILELSHDCNCLATTSALSVANLTNFVYLVNNQTRRAISLVGRQIEPRKYAFRPSSDLPLGETVRFGIKAVDGSHPNFPEYRGRTVVLRDLKRVAQLSDKAHIYREWKVEPKFLITAVTVYGPNERVIQFQGVPAEDSAVDGERYIYFPDNED